MANIVEILEVAAISAIVTLLVRELFAWKFSELERRREKLEMLLEKVYGPIRVVTWRMDHDEQTIHKYMINTNEYSEIQRIVYMYGYEFDQNYREIIDFFLNQSWKEISLSFSGGESDYLEYGLSHYLEDTSIPTCVQLATEPHKIKELIEKTETIYNNINERIIELHNMRSGFRNNLKFIFLKWRF